MLLNENGPTGICLDQEHKIKYEYAKLRKKEGWDKNVQKDVVNEITILKMIVRAISNSLKEHPNILSVIDILEDHSDLYVIKERQ